MGVTSRGRGGDRWQHVTREHRSGSWWVAWVDRLQGRVHCSCRNHRGPTPCHHEWAVALFCRDEEPWGRAA